MPCYFSAQTSKKQTINKERRRKKFLKPEPELEPINLFPGADIKIYPQHYSTDLSLRSSSWKSVVSSCSPSSRSFSSHSRRFSSHSSLQVITFMFWILREIRKRWKAEKNFKTTFNAHYLPHHLSNIVGFCWAWLLSNHFPFSSVHFLFSM